MLSIITYSNSLSSEFKNKNVILLKSKNLNGFDDDKYKIESVINFCDSKKKNDIVLYIPPCGVLLLENSNSILRKFNTLNVDLLFSRNVHARGIKEKYILDREPNSCNNLRINTNLYIGRAESISSIWRDYLKEKKCSTTVYISKLCLFSNTQINIDEKNLLFYNYTVQDKITLKKNKFYANDNKDNLQIISFKNSNESINFIKKQKLNLKLCRHQKKKFWGTSEIIFLVIIVFLLVIFKFNVYSILICVIIFIFFIEIRLHIAQMNNTLAVKVKALLLDISHYFLFIPILILKYFLIIRMLLWKYHPKLTILLNIAIFIVILQFFIFKRCVFSVYMDRLLGFNNTFQNYLVHSLIYPFSNKPYVKNIVDKKNLKKSHFTYQWMNAHKFNLASMIILNIYLLIRLHYFP